MRYFCILIFSERLLLLIHCTVNNCEKVIRNIIIIFKIKRKLTINKKKVHFKILCISIETFKTAVLKLKIIVSQKK